MSGHHASAQAQHAAGVLAAVPITLADCLHQAFQTIVPTAEENILLGFEVSEESPRRNVGFPRDIDNCHPFETLFSVDLHCGVDQRLSCPTLLALTETETGLAGWRSAFHAWHLLSCTHASMQDCNYLRDPDVEANARLTGYVAVVLVVLLAAEFVTGLRSKQRSGIELWLFGYRFGFIWVPLHHASSYVWFVTMAVRRPASFSRRMASALRGRSRHRPM